MAEEIKRVSSDEFDRAYDELMRNFTEQTGMERYRGIEFHFTYDRSTDRCEKPWKRPQYMQVNWAAIGTVMPEDAAEFGKALMVAAKLAENFIYNGYKVTYSD